MFEKKKLKECTMESIKIALLGLGTVGTGVYKVLKAQKEEGPETGSTGGDQEDSGKKPGKSSCQGGRPFCSYQ